MEYYYIICHLNYIYIPPSVIDNISDLQQLSGEHVCTSIFLHFPQLHVIQRLKIIMSPYASIIPSVAL